MKGGEVLTEERQGSVREVWGPRDKKSFLGQFCVCVCVCVCVCAGVHAVVCMFGGDRAEFYIHF